MTVRFWCGVVVGRRVGREVPRVWLGVSRGVVVKFQGCGYEPPKRLVRFQGCGGEGPGVVL